MNQSPGVKTRSRKCTKGGVLGPVSRLAGQNLGLDLFCEGEDFFYEICSENKCPEWSGWENWSECSSCDNGVRQRVRACDNGGDDVESQIMKKSDGKFDLCIGSPEETEMCEKPGCDLIEETCEGKIDRKKASSSVSRVAGASSTCKNWAEVGMCNDENTKHWIVKNCERSCCDALQGFVCANVKPKCSNYKSYCRNTKYSSWMNKNCPVTCKTCMNDRRASQTGFRLPMKRFGLLKSNIWNDGEKEEILEDLAPPDFY